jgi:hypothetical protein
MSAPAVLPAPTPVAKPTPAPAPQPAPTPAPSETPMARAKARMTASSVEADLSDPNPEQTVRQKKAAAEPTKPTEPLKATDEPPAADDLEGEDAPPKPDALKPEDKPPDKPFLDEKGKPIDPKKVSPWKLLDQFKGRLTAAEKENIELKEKLAKLPDFESASKTEKRNKELEEEIRYQNYAKSQEFSDKYAKPYEEAWTKAVSDLGELEVLAEDGTPSRKATANDLISLARMPLGEARKLANQMFGDSASDVMMHRQKIRDLSDAQTKALEEARKTGSERQVKAVETSKAITSEVTSLWQKFNEEAVGKYEFLKPREGDDEHNAKLDKAKALVDTAFSQNATDPSLTPEQRAKAVRAHAAVRNRAIAYSALKLENTRLKAQIAERDTKLKQFEDSEPTGGTGGGQGAQPKPAATPMERARQRLNAASVPAPQYY